MHTIKAIARKHDLIIGITDHNKIGGSLAARAMKIPVVPAIEVTTRNLKDFLVYFHDFDSLINYFDTVVKPALNPGRIWGSKTNLSIQELIDGARDNNGFISLAHPYCPPPKRTGNLSNDYMRQMDAIEVMNFGVSPKANKKAALLCDYSGKVFTAGSDSHHPTTIGKVTMRAHSTIPDEFLSEVMQGHAMVVGYQRKTKDVVKYVRNYLRTR